MGLTKFFSCGRTKQSSGSVSTTTNNIKNTKNIFNGQPDVNPNPYVFKILDSEEVNNNLILLVNYPNCTTFGGNKLLLLRGTKYNKQKLDPHFFEGKHPVIARFQPNEQGWILARECAKLF